MQKFQISKLIVQSYCLAEVSNKKASKPIFKNSWVNRFVESRLARIMHGNQNLTIHGSIDLVRRGLHEKCTNSKLMVQSYCLAEVNNKKASKPIFKNSWVNRFVESRLARIMHGNQNLTIHGSIDLVRRGLHEKCRNSKFQN